MKIVRNRWIWLASALILVAICLAIFDLTTIHVRGRITGTADIGCLVFVGASNAVERNIFNPGKHYRAILPKPGPYYAYYRVMNNFKRLVHEDPITSDMVLDIHYDQPSMTVSVTNVPPTLSGGDVMVYMTDKYGNYSGCTPENVHRFSIDLTGTPWLFLESYDALVFVVGHEREGYRLPCTVAIGETRFLDFAQATRCVWPPKRRDTEQSPAGDVLKAAPEE